MILGEVVENLQVGPLVKSGLKIIYRVLNGGGGFQGEGVP